MPIDNWDPATAVADFEGCKMHYHARDELVNSYFMDPYHGMGDSSSATPGTVMRLEDFLGETISFSSDPPPAPLKVPVAIDDSLGSLGSESIRVTSAVRQMQSFQVQF